jgi:hypothetical protein
MLVKSLITTTALAVATATSAGPALAGADTLRTAHAQTGAKHGRTAPAAPRIKWTPEQLQALGEAYKAKNPGWRVPVSSGVVIPADVTWTSENLDRLANAYAALNPGWIRP